MSAAFTFDVFLSYSTHDRSVVREIAERLRSSNLRVWFDQWEIRPGDHILQKIEEGLDQSRVLVLCMSEHAFGSDWSLLEAGTFRFRDPLNRERRLVPLRLDGSPVKGSLRQLAYLDWKRSDGSESFTELLDACLPFRLSARVFEDVGEDNAGSDQSDSDRRESDIDITPRLLELKTSGRDVSREVVAGEDAQVRSVVVGGIVGHYRLVSLLRKDNFSTTFIAERSDRQYSARVEIKIFDNAAGGMLSQRLRADRQFLAALSHPGIARLFDVGETDDGQPYLVNEHVNGETLDRYCDDQNLSLQARLALFLQICDVVQYVHRNLIVCRSLSPNDILVTKEGAPKLLNVGIARLIDVVADTDDDLALARVHAGSLLPEYASPEQILGRSITTASDIYTLGVLLYELLTGMQPYHVSSAGQFELERSICVEDPERPSLKIRRSSMRVLVKGSKEFEASKADAVASVRDTTRRRLEHGLMGDLDAIVMRALRKEPEHRYISVEQLARDIRSHLNNEPVLARQGSWIYYTQRFIKRNVVVVTVSVFLWVMMLSFIVTLLIRLRPHH